MTMKSSSSQSGNVLFYILIAVALLAALSYAVSQGGRGSAAGITQERAKLAAADILAYSNTLSTAVSQLKLRGCSDIEISFEFANKASYANTNAPDDHSCDVFHPSGGGVAWQQIPADVHINGIATDYIFNGYDAVENIGTAESELIMYGPEIKDAVCIEINKMIGQITDDDVIEEAADIHPGNFAGVYYSNVTIGAGGTEFSGQKSGCFFAGPWGANVFYRVLIAR